LHAFGQHVLMKGELVDCVQLNSDGFATVIQRNPLFSVYFKELFPGSAGRSLK
jgi:hypothetical protein